MNEKMTPTFFQPFFQHIACKKLGQLCFHTLLANLFKQRHISSATSYKYLNKLIKALGLGFSRTTVYMRIIPFKKL